jgi:NADPH:quinone reductase-like Zn-dependent oxidoreductase
MGLARFYQLKANEIVLVQGASGGVGSLNFALGQGHGRDSDRHGWVRRKAGASRGRGRS